MTTVHVINGVLAAPLKMDVRSSQLLRALEGRRRWLSNGLFQFEASRHNLDSFRSIYPEFTVDRGPPKDAPREPATPIGERKVGAPRTKPYAHQERALQAARQHHVFALFMEQGTGKTKVAIDRAVELWAAGTIDAVLVVTKKGVHTQWIMDELPKHMPHGVAHDAAYWNAKKFLPDTMVTNAASRLKFFAINVDALITEAGSLATTRFVTSHNGRVLMIVDESQVIKSSTAARTKACNTLGKQVTHRMILTGTPIAKDLTDEWSQFNFLDNDIIGVKYLVSFRGEYCVMGGFEGKQIVGTRNLDKFKRLVDPYSFRVTKEEELDLPPKQYAQQVFEMHPEQRKHFRALRDNFITMLDSGEVSSVKNAAVLVMRLQQITCGMLPSTDSDSYMELPNPRLDALEELIEARPGKTVIWARFNHDIKQIEKLLGARCRTYYGATTSKDREEAVRKFLDPNSGVDFFVSNPQAGGTGLNLQGECRTVIFYSNGFNAIDRWQAEDRTHRIGTNHTITYFDLVCVGSPDKRILANLRNKKSLSDLALGDIKEIIHDI
jgi:SNF2 family DNA or RNA helicase